MKKYIPFIFLSAGLFAKSSKAIVLNLDKPDSIVVIDFVSGKDKTVRGFYTTVEVKGKKFALGCFEVGLIPNYSYNDSATNNACFYIYKETGDKAKNTFYVQQNSNNKISVKLFKHLYLEGMAYKARYINSRQLELIPESANPLSVQEESHDVLTCIYDIHYFAYKFRDVQGKEIPEADLFEKGKLNIVYFTADYCQPCREVRDSMINLSNTSKTINVVFVTGNEGDSKGFEKSYAAARKKYYSGFTRGYPTRFYFDGDGNLVPPSLVQSSLKKYTAVPQ